MTNTQDSISTTRAREIAIAIVVSTLACAAPATAGPTIEFGGTASNSKVLQSTSGANVPTWISDPRTAPFLSQNPSTLVQQMGAGTGNYGDIAFQGLHFYAGQLFDQASNPGSPCGSLRTSCTIGGDSNSPSGFLTERPPVGSAPASVELVNSVGLSSTSPIQSTFFQFQGTIDLTPSPVIGDADYTLRINHDDGFSLKFWLAGTDPNDPTNPSFGVFGSLGTSTIGILGPSGVGACQNVDKWQADQCYENYSIIIPASFGPNTQLYQYSLSLGSGPGVPTRLDATLVPEPSTIGILGMGLAVLTGTMTLRRRGSHHKL